MTEKEGKPLAQETSRTPDKPRHIWVIAAAVAGALVLLGVAGYRWVAAEALATLTVFSGNPERDTVTAPLAWQKAAVGDDFEAGEGARTPEASVADFVLVNGAKLRLRPASQVRFQRPSAGAAVQVDVDVGEAEIQTGAGGVTIGSEFGAITLDPQSSITMTREGARLNVVVELGRIQVSEREVSAGHSIEVLLGGIVVDAPATAESAQAEAVPTEAVPAASESEAELAELELGAGVGYADLVVSPGERFVIHDPNPPTAIGFRVAESCDGPARLSIGQQTTEAVGQANLRLGRGQHAYEVRCLSEPGVVAARGQVRVLEDAGTRLLPSFAPTANVVTDGRSYTVLYQHRLPKVTVSWPTAPKADSYTLKIGERAIQTRSPQYTFGALARGSHRLLFSADTKPLRQSRATTIEVVYDTQAPTGRISTSPTPFESGQAVTISGQALPGWQVSVGGQAVETDGQRKFSVDVDGRETIPIAFSHPKQDTHYYVRRRKASP